MENETDVIYIHPQKRIVSQKRKYFYLSFTGTFFLFIGLVSGTPAANWSGLLTILTSPSNLLTDYFALGGFRKRIYKRWDLDLTFCAFGLPAKGDFKWPLIRFDFNSYRFFFFWQKPL